MAKPAKLSGCIWEHLLDVEQISQAMAAMANKSYLEPTQPKFNGE